MTTNPWTDGVLPRKFIELVSLGLNAACTKTSIPTAPAATSAPALTAGATRDEILFVLKCASVMSIHSCSLGAPIPLEEAKAAGKPPAPKPVAATPACDEMTAVGQWNSAWDPFYQLDPLWTDEFMAAAVEFTEVGSCRPRRSSC